MAQITIIIPDAVIQRIRAAFGLNGQVATDGEVMTAIKTFVKGRVISFERDRVRKDIEKLAEDKAQEVSKEVW